MTGQKRKRPTTTTTSDGGSSFANPSITSKSPSKSASSSSSSSNHARQRLQRGAKDKVYAERLAASIDNIVEDPVVVAPDGTSERSAGVLVVAASSGGGEGDDDAMVGDDARRRRDGNNTPGGGLVAIGGGRRPVDGEQHAGIADDRGMTADTAILEESSIPSRNCGINNKNIRRRGHEKTTRGSREPSSAGSRRRRRAGGGGVERIIIPPRWPLSHPSVTIADEKSSSSSDVVMLASSFRGVTTGEKSSFPKSDVPKKRRRARRSSGWADQEEEGTSNNEHDGKRPTTTEHVHSGSTDDDAPSAIDCVDSIDDAIVHSSNVVASTGLFNHDNNDGGGGASSLSAREFAEQHGPSAKRHVNQRPPTYYLGPKKDSPSRPSKDWSCNQCTLRNSNRRKKCQACGINRLLTLGTTDNGTLTAPDESPPGDNVGVCYGEENDDRSSSTPQSALVVDSVIGLACGLDNHKNIMDQEAFSSEEKRVERDPFVKQIASKPSPRNFKPKKDNPSRLSKDWSCNQCTLLNSNRRKKCQACGFRRHSAMEDEGALALDQSQNGNDVGVFIEHNDDDNDGRSSSSTPQTASVNSDNHISCDSEQCSQNGESQQQSQLALAVTDGLAPSASALREAKAVKVNIIVGQEHITLLSDVCDPTTGIENGTMRPNDSMANHVAGSLSYQLMAYVPTPDFSRVKGLTYNESISNGTNKVEHHHTTVNSKDYEVALREEKNSKDNDHRVDLDDSTNDSTAFTQRSSLFEAESRHDSGTMQDDAGNANVNEQASIPKKPKTNEFEPHTSPSKSFRAVILLSSSNRDDFDDNVSPLYHYDSYKPSTISCHDACNLSLIDENVQHQPDSSGDKTLIDGRENFSRPGWTADKSAIELVQTNSYQSIREGQSNDSPCMQMTQQPTFDYFSQASIVSLRSTSNVTSRAVEMFEDRQKSLEVLQDGTQVNIGIGAIDRPTPGDIKHCDQDSKHFAQRCHEDTDKPSTIFCHDACNLSLNGENVQRQPDSSGDKTLIDGRENCSRRGWTADKSAIKLVQTNSYQSIRGGQSNDSPCMQMTQQPTFDYFSQASIESLRSTSNVTSRAVEMFEDRQKSLEVLQDGTQVNIGIGAIDRPTPGDIKHCDQDSKHFAQRCHEDTDKPSTIFCHDACNLSLNGENVQRQPDSSGDKTLIDGRENCSRRGWTADKSAIELVQTNSYQSIRGGQSNDSPCMQMTQQPTFDYFS
ncbi:hypothetical protein ACHAXA_007524, partial [Cyclostephanos tholiformis]